jgi:Mce-associated membrane protein
MAARRGALWWSLTVVLALAVLATAGFGAWQAVRAEPVPPADSAQARQVVIDVAKSSAVKMLSYTPENVETQTREAAEGMTGAFRNYYTQFTHDVVVPAAKSKGVDTSATVPGAAVESLSADAATLILFINQSTTSAAAAPTTANSSVRLGLQKINGAWLIAKFDPL